MKYKQFLSTILIFILQTQINIRKAFAEINTNSIITHFCLENVKAEMKKADIVYSEKIGKNTCDCYLKNILNNTNHEQSISRCKIQIEQKFKLQSN